MFTINIHFQNSGDTSYVEGNTAVQVQLNMFILPQKVNIYIYIVLYTLENSILSMFDIADFKYRK